MIFLNRNDVTAAQVSPHQQLWWHGHRDRMTQNSNPAAARSERWTVPAARVDATAADVLHRYGIHWNPK